MSDKSELKIKKKINSLEQLIDSLQYLNDKSFLATRTKIAKFVEKKSKNKELADKIRNCKTTREAISELEYTSCIEIEVPIRHKLELLTYINEKKEDKLLKICKDKNQINAIARILKVKPKRLDILKDCNSKEEIYRVIEEFVLDLKPACEPAVKSSAQIYEHLSNYVIGQDRVLKQISGVFARHLRHAKLCIENNETSRNLACMLVGGTGCGKTYIVRKAAEFCKLPFLEVDITGYSASGYVGMDVHKIISQLEDRYDGDPFIDYAVVFIDEIDKKRRNAGDLDVSGSLVQYELLKMIEGTNVVITDINNHPEGEFYTGDLLFILAGAFSDINRGRSFIGFTSPASQDSQAQITIQDLENYGMVPELLRRVPFICTLNNLTVENFKDILTKSGDSPIKQIEKEYNHIGIEIEFDNSAIEYIAKKAYSMNIGATALDAVCNECFSELEFFIDKLEKKGYLKITEEFCRDPANYLKHYLKI